MIATWLTDIHLNFVGKERRQQFYEDIKAEKSNCVLISGDIADAMSTCSLLKEMQQAIDLPIFFVAGNHDFYHGSVGETNQNFQELKLNNIHYLTDCDAINLSSETVLVGVDGWADGVHGDYENSSVVLNDSRLIKELSDSLILKISGYSKEHKAILLANMKKLAAINERRLVKQLSQAITFKPKTIIIVTHIPPFKECCLYQGRISGDDFIPFYSCAATGNVIDHFAKKHTNINFLVLCGHTHDKCIYQRYDNLKIMVGEAQYRYPQIQIGIDY